jgi:membrane protease YdiL (CAAX protease family)
MAITREFQSDLNTAASSVRNRPSRRNRDLLEFCTAYGLIALAVWTPRPWQQWLSLAALLWVLLTTWLSFDGWRAMGFRVVGFWRSTWVIGVALGLVAAGVAAAARLQTLHAPESPALFLSRYWSYTIWAFLQEFLLLNFFLLRLLRLLPNRIGAAMVATALFALVHLPNPVLTPLTLIWGYAACLIFLRYRNLYIPAVVHALFGICIAVTIPGPVDHNMRVGLGYLTYREHGHHRVGLQRSQIDHTVSTVAWVIAEAPIRRSLRQARP